ncbi:hypothetical protein HHK36_024046 [Tetracentron sinense]|uniref:DUF4283 domain-containing protein n=1 Tax=Tetracentron sinense TaxID=13715 RepID=A0A834YLX8_TETSI|nr:hypothetical protein HHK36_024046 [Tetracentron sinense]
MGRFGQEKRPNLSGRQWAVAVESNRRGGRVRRFAVEAKSFVLEKVNTKEGWMLKIMEKIKRGAWSSMWMPVEAIQWMERMVNDCLEASGYMFRRFRGHGITILGEKRANVRGDFLMFQTFLEAGKGGRLFIPRGDRSLGWKALVEALMCFNPCLRNSDPAVHTRLESPSPLTGLRSHVEQVDGIKGIVMDLDAGVFRHWAAAVVCSLVSSSEPVGASARWEEVVQLLEKLLPEEGKISLFPCESDRAIFHPKREASIFRICNNKSFYLGSSLVVGFHRWWPESNAISYSGLIGSRWIALKGIPFHLWVPSVFSQIGQICGGLVAIHPDTERCVDLSMAKIRVRGDVRSIPRFIPLSFHSISYPVEVLIWKGEICSVCLASLESLGGRHHVGKEGTSGCGGVRGEVDPLAAFPKSSVHCFPEVVRAVPLSSNALQQGVHNGMPSSGEVDPGGFVHDKAIPAKPTLSELRMHRLSPAGLNKPQADSIFKIQNTKLKGRMMWRNQRRSARRKRIRVERSGVRGVGGEEFPSAEVDGSVAGVGEEEGVFREDLLGINLSLPRALDWVSLSAGARVEQAALMHGLKSVIVRVLGPDSGEPNKLVVAQKTDVSLSRITKVSAHGFRDPDHFGSAQVLMSPVGQVTHSVSSKDLSDGIGLAAPDFGHSVDRLDSQAGSRQRTECRVGISSEGKLINNQQCSAEAARRSGFGSEDIQSGSSLERYRRSSFRQGLLPLPLDLGHGVGRRPTQRKEHGVMSAWGNRCYRKVYCRRIRSTGRDSSGVGSLSDHRSPGFKSPGSNPNFLLHRADLESSKEDRIARGSFHLLRRSSSDESLESNSVTQFKLKSKDPNLDEKGSEGQVWAVGEDQSGQDEVEQSVGFTTETELSQSVSVVRATKEKDLAAPTEEGDSLEEWENLVSDSENSQEGSSDEEGVRRMHLTESDGEEVQGVDLEKNGTSSNGLEVEVGGWSRREILASVDKSVEVSKLLGLQFAGGEDEDTFIMESSDDEKNGPIENYIPKELSHSSALNGTKFVEEVLSSQNERCQENFRMDKQDCVGAVDGIHIPVMVGVDEQGPFRNKNGVLSQNVLAACSFDLMFHYVLAGWEGSAADLCVLNSALTRRNKLHVPEAACAIHNYIRKEKGEDWLFKMYEEESGQQIEEQMPQIEMEATMQMETRALDIAFEAELEIASQVRDSIAAEMWNDHVRYLSSC